MHKLTWTWTDGVLTASFCGISLSEGELNQLLLDIGKLDKEKTDRRIERERAEHMQKILANQRVVTIDGVNIRVQKSPMCGSDRDVACWLDGFDRSNAKWVVVRSGLGRTDSRSWVIEGDFRKWRSNPELRETICGPGGRELRFKHWEAAVKRALELWPNVHQMESS